MKNSSVSWIDRNSFTPLAKRGRLAREGAAPPPATQDESATLVALPTPKTVPEVDGSAETIRKLQLELQASQMRVRALQEDLRTLRERAAESPSPKLAELESQIRQMQEAGAQARDNERRLREQIQRDLEKAQAGAQESRQHAAASLQAETAAAQQQLAEARAALASFEVERNAAAQRLTGLEAKYANLRTQAARRIAELEKALAAEQAQRAQALENTGDETLKNLQYELARVQARFAQAEARCRALARLPDEIDSVKKQLKAALEENAALKAQGQG